MGIPGFWEIVKDAGEDKNLAEWANEVLAKNGRPLRLAVDEAHWRYKGITVQAERGIQVGNPRERNVLERLWPLLRLGIQLIFVFDGKDRPDEKRGKKTEGRKEEDYGRFVREILTQLGLPCHDAPGEAEAECARLQILGLVDAVWTEDSDTFMFGCTVVITNLYHEKEGKCEINADDCKVKMGQKCRVGVRRYRAEDVEHHSGIKSPHGVMLYALLSGCDYTAGLKGCGQKMAKVLAAKPLLVAAFEQALTEAQLKTWRKRLSATITHLVPGMVQNKDFPSNIESFPSTMALGYARNPRVSNDSDLLRRFGDKGRDWYGSHTTDSLTNLLPWLKLRFHNRRSLAGWLPFIAPAELVRMLLKEEPAARGFVSTVTPSRSGVRSVTIDPRSMFPGMDVQLTSNPDLKKYKPREPVEEVTVDILDTILGHAMSPEAYQNWCQTVLKEPPRRGRPPKAKATDPLSLPSTGSSSVDSPGSQYEERQRE